MQADRAHALMRGDAQPLHERPYPRVINLNLTVEVDPEYKPGEEQRGVRTPLLDELGPASDIFARYLMRARRRRRGLLAGMTRLLRLLMKWLPMRIKDSGIAIVDMEKGNWSCLYAV